MTGPIRDILLAERTALNCLSRASGIASLTKEIVDKVRGAGWNGKGVDFWYLYFEFACT